MKAKKLAMLALAAASLSACHAQSQTTTPPYGVFYYQRATLFDALPVDSTDIIMLGNSLTNGCEWHELLGMPNVKNRGITSDVIAGISDRLPALVNGQPAKIFLLIGVNDISHNLPVADIAAEYATLIDKIREQMPNTKLYVQSCLPVNISFGKYAGMADKEDEIVDLNTALKAMADEKGYTYIDLWSAFADQDGHMRRELTNDGLHLLGQGYLVWRDCILPYINE
ncbi:MAG: hypothetical protein K2N16_06530 [Muribaculaceae bacterium]|nr:hypothetical protein [Muribaculaceae bacterium]